MKPHKHAEAIKAWADGYEIEMFNSDGEWVDVPYPSWALSMEYRIKREPKPDIVEEAYLFGNMAIPITANLKDASWDRWLNNGSAYKVVGEFKLTYDGETRQLKAAELIK